MIMPTTSTFTKEYIQEKLTTDTRWVERALVVLHDRQTAEEQENQATHNRNGRGFNGRDAGYLSYCAEWVKKGNHISGKHAENCGKSLKKYWRQILEEIEVKQGVSQAEPLEAR